MKIQLKRSNVLEGGKAKEPTASQMEYGELAVNYNENDPSLFIKDNNNNIVKIADLTIPGDGALTIQTSGGDSASGTFTANQSGPSTLTLPQISYSDLKDVPPAPAAPGNGALTIRTSGGDNATGTFTANQAGPSTLTLPQISYSDLKDVPPVGAAPGDGKLTIETSGGDTATGTFTANQNGDSTLTLPAIAYSDLTGKPTIPAAANNGALTIKTSGGDNATGTFTANQSGPSTLTLPQISYSDLKDVPPVGAAPGNGTITIVQPGTTNQTFTVNQNNDTTITLKNDNTQVTPGNGALTIETSGGDAATGSFTANQSGPSTLTLPAIAYSDLTGKPSIPAAANNGALTIETSSGDAATGTFTANQAGASTLTLPQISYSDLKDVPPVGAAPGNGTITIVQPGTTNQTFTVNQNSDQTITLKNDNTQVTPGNGALTIETSGGDTATGTFTANQSGASTLTLPAISYADLTDKPSIPAAAGNGTITIVQPGTSNQTFTVNQSGNKTITLKNDNTVVTPGDGALTIETSGGDAATGTFTANQSGASTLTLPAIAYSDLTGKPSIPAAANNGTITIRQPGVNNQSFTVNQSGNTTIDLRNDNTVVTPGNGALTIRTSGGDNATGSFTANQSNNATITLPAIPYSDLTEKPSIPAPANNGRITIKQPGTSDQSFTVNQSGNTTINLKNDNTVTTPGNGALTIKTSGGDSATGTFTANQSSGSTLTLPAIDYSDLTGRPSIPAAAGNGTITIVQPGTSNQTFTVNQSGNKTITLKNDNTQASTNLTNSASATVVNIESSTGDNTGITGATTSKAGVMTASQVTTLNGALQRSGGTMSGDINMGGNHIDNIEYIAGPTTSTALPIYSRSGSSQSSLLGDGFGWTVSQASSNQCAGIRYKSGNAWIGLTYVSGGTMSPYYNNTFWGNIAITGSDVRLKKDISTIADGALDTINALNPVKFRWKDVGYYTASQRSLDPEGTFTYGFIADEIQTILPEAMVLHEPSEEIPEQMKDYDNRVIISMLCKALQELSAKVDTLEAQLNP